MRFQLTISRKRQPKKEEVNPRDRRKQARVARILQRQQQPQEIVLGGGKEEGEEEEGDLTISRQHHHDNKKRKLARVARILQRQQQEPRQEEEVNVEEEEEDGWDDDDSTSRSDRPGAIPVDGPDATTTTATGVGVAFAGINSYASIAVGSTTTTTSNAAVDADIPSHNRPNETTAADTNLSLPQADIIAAEGFTADDGDEEETERRVAQRLAIALEEQRQNTVQAQEVVVLAPSGDDHHNNDDDQQEMFRTNIKRRYLWYSLVCFMVFVAIITTSIVVLQLPIESGRNTGGDESSSRSESETRNNDTTIDEPATTASPVSSTSSLRPTANPSSPTRSTSFPPRSSSPTTSPSATPRPTLTASPSASPSLLPTMMPTIPCELELTLDHEAICERKSPSTYIDFCSIRPYRMTFFYRGGGCNETMATGCQTDQEASCVCLPRPAEITENLSTCCDRIAQVGKEAGECELGEFDGSPPGRIPGRRDEESPPLDAVYVVVRANATREKYFSGPVTIGDIFDAVPEIGSVLDFMDLEVYGINPVTSQSSGELLQRVSFHSSNCEEVFQLLDVFGGFQLIEFAYVDACGKSEIETSRAEVPSYTADVNLTVNANPDGDFEFDIGQIFLSDVDNPNPADIDVLDLNVSGTHLPPALFVQTNFIINKNTEYQLRAVVGGRFNGWPCAGFTSSRFRCTRTCNVEPSNNQSACT